MNAPPRLIATDLDGTIVRHDSSVSRRVLEVFTAAADEGIRVVFVTGRPPRWMREVADVTGHSGVGICANGAYVYDMHAEAVTETFAIPLDDARDAVRRVREVLPSAAMGMESEAGFAHEPHYRPRWNPDSLLGIGPIEEHLSDAVAKLLVRDDVLSGDAMLDLASPTLLGVVEVTHSNVHDSLLELSALGVTKASTLSLLAQRWGIGSDEVVAFGDMPNDVEMLRWAGTGYAMGNAHPMVLAAADAQAPSIDDDGVALVLEEILGRQ